MICCFATRVLTKQSFNPCKTTDIALRLHNYVMCAVLSAGGIPIQCAIDRLVWLASGTREITKPLFSTDCHDCRRQMLDPFLFSFLSFLLEDGAYPRRRLLGTFRTSFVRLVMKKGTCAPYTWYLNRARPRPHRFLTLLFGIHFAFSLVRGDRVPGNYGLNRIYEQLIGSS